MANITISEDRFREIVQNAVRQARSASSDTVTSGNGGQQTPRPTTFQDMMQFLAPTGPGSQLVKIIAQSLQQPMQGVLQNLLSNLGTDVSFQKALREAQLNTQFNPNEVVGDNFGQWLANNASTISNQICPMQLRTLPDRLPSVIAAIAAQRPQSAYRGEDYVAIGQSGSWEQRTN